MRPTSFGYRQLEDGSPASAEGQAGEERPPSHEANKSTASLYTNGTAYCASSLARSTNIRGLSDAIPPVVLCHSGLKCRCNLMFLIHSHISAVRNHIFLRSVGKTATSARPFSCELRSSPGQQSLIAFRTGFQNARRQPPRSNMDMILCTSRGI